MTAEVPLTRRTLLAATPLAALFTAAAAAGPKWDPLFDGPPLHKQCQIGALRPGDRFRDPRDRRKADWVVVDQLPITRDRTPDERAGGENWPVPIGRKAVDVDTGTLAVWPWDAVVIRTR